MKKKYIAPKAEVINLFTESAILAGSLRKSEDAAITSEDMILSNKTIWNYNESEAE